MKDLGLLSDAALDGCGEINCCCWEHYGERNMEACFGDVMNHFVCVKTQEEWPWTFSPPAAMLGESAGNRPTLRFQRPC